MMCTSNKHTNFIKISKEAGILLCENGTSCAMLVLSVFGLVPLLFPSYLTYTLCPSPLFLPALAYSPNYALSRSYK